VLQLPSGRKEKDDTLWRGYAHGPQQDVLGMLAGRRTAIPPHLQEEGGSQTQDQTTAAEPPRAGAIGDGGRALPGAVRRRTRRRLLGWRTPVQSGAGPP
jgi:hypothetical protein